jgi:hypothetical protein
VSGPLTPLPLVSYLGSRWPQEKGASMSEPHTKIADYANELLDVPRAHLALELSQDEDGLKLRYGGTLLVECYLTNEGMAAGAYMAKALGVPVPALGESVTARVSTGVLFRAVGIASLDFGVDESFVLLERWLQEAEMQRGGVSELS